MEHEKSIIPVIITRCIQEVELRGMFELLFSRHDLDLTFP